MMKQEGEPQHLPEEELANRLPTLSWTSSTSISPDPPQFSRNETSDEFIEVSEFQEQDDRDVYETTKLLHHHRQPSTILEENTFHDNDDALNSPSNDESTTGMPQRSKSHSSSEETVFVPSFTTTLLLGSISKRLLPDTTSSAAWLGFWALLHVTCANYVLTPMKDAIALSIGVSYIPQLTLASTVLAFFSSVPIGWLFEAPDPSRRRLWKRMGLTRGETQGTSLALFYRCFGIILGTYAIGFTTIEWLQHRYPPSNEQATQTSSIETRYWWLPDLHALWVVVGQILYIAFFLVVHLMKLHSLSLVWGVTTEAMEYEEVAQQKSQQKSHKSRLQRLSLVGFGGTLGGVLGSVMASSLAQVLKLPGLLLLSSVLLEIAAELSIEIGRIMQKHWEEQQLFQSNNDLTSLDTSMKRSSSLGSMKRVASGNSLNRVRSTGELDRQQQLRPQDSTSSTRTSSDSSDSGIVNEDSFVQRLLRGITTILRSRLLMAIFTYNALYASTTVLLSFQRAVLVANRDNDTSTEQDTAFLAKVNMASSVAIFLLQASGLGASLAQLCGPRGTLSLTPLIRLAGVISLAWWHRTSKGQPPNLIIFLMVDECCKIMNLAVAKPVRESLWRGLSNEARYEAKPIVDTLANRWGGGSAAFLVAFINKALDLFGVEPNTEGIRMILGFPPILFLCMIIAAWWTVVSADLGQIRRRIDIELKKRE